MSGSRGSFAAIIVALVLAFAAGITVTALDYRSDYQERYPSYTAVSENGGTTSRNLSRSERATNKVPCSGPQSREESELCAQWRAATGTKQAARWALWQLLLSLLGVIGLGFTLWFNKRAIDLALESGRDTEMALATAERNAEAAASQVRIAQETAYRQLRAYVSIENVEIDGVAPALIGGTIFVRNAGKTPAKIEVYLNRYIGQWPILQFPDDAPQPFRYDFHGPFVNAGCREQIDWFYPMGAPDPDAPQKIAQLLAGNAALFLYGRVEFVDFQRRRRVLHFAYRNHGRVGLEPKCEMTPLPFGNTYEDRGIEQP